MNPVQTYSLTHKSSDAVHTYSLSHKSSDPVTTVALAGGVARRQSSPKRVTPAARKGRWQPWPKLVRKSSAASRRKGGRK